MIKAFLALGSNLQNPVMQVTSAMEELNEIPQTSVIKKSSLYRNPPIGIIDQPDFINAVVLIETNLSAQNLLESLFQIENKHQRIRKEKNGPRTLDLDILTYGNQKIDLSFLQVPHPRLKERAFVLVPLNEIDPQLILPCGTSVSNLLSNIKEPKLEVFYE